MRFLLGAVSVALLTSSVSAAQIEGDYLEARSCAVYSGECFANAEAGLAGKEALMAWKVDTGTWNDIDLGGLGVALIVTAERTIGSNRVTPLAPGKTESVILVDKRATSEQRAALIDFVRSSNQKLTKNVVAVQHVPFELKADHVSGKSAFAAGKVAKIETRAVAKGDCVCSNEIKYYEPLAKIRNEIPVFTLTHAYQGKDLDRRWTSIGSVSAYLGTFRK